MPILSTTPIFIAPQHQATLAHNHLLDFDAIWDKEIPWFEPPNKRRGGWSGVGRINLTGQNGEALDFFVKKQENHGRKSWAHPFVGEPTFRREFLNLQFLQKQGIGAPKVVYYAENTSQKQAILITENLVGFAPLDITDLNVLNIAQQQILMKAVAREVKHFHCVGLVHRALYPKHIFVKNAQTAPEIALIDLEKARFSPLSYYRTYFDLAAFFRHLQGGLAAYKDLFLNAYLGKPELNFFEKLLYARIMRRANRE